MEFVYNDYCFDDDEIERKGTFECDYEFEN